MTFENIKELLKIFSDSTIAKLEIQDGDTSITLDKANTTPATKEKISEPETTVSTAIENTNKNTDTNIDTNSVTTENIQNNVNLTEIKSPMVGTFYKSPSPDSPSFVQIGEVVRKGQKICVLEAMKIMNELEAEFDCKIVEILVENTSAVEYDMPLFKVEKL